MGNRRVTNAELAQMLNESNATLAASILELRRQQGEILTRLEFLQAHLTRTDERLERLWQAVFGNGDHNHAGIAEQVRDNRQKIAVVEEDVKRVAADIKRIRADIAWIVKLVLGWVVVSLILGIAWYFVMRGLKSLHAHEIGIWLAPASVWASRNMRGWWGIIQTARMMLR